MKKFFVWIGEVVSMGWMIIITIGMMIGAIINKSFIVICNIIAVLNLIWLSASLTLILFTFFIRDNSGASGLSDWEKISHSFFTFYFHPHGLFMICLVGIIIIITIWRWLHFALNAKFIKENYIK